MNWSAGQMHFLPQLLGARLPAVIFCVLALYCSSPAAAQVVIDFEDLQPVTVLNQYANRGVSFNGPLARDYSQTPGLAHSGSKAIELCFAIEFCTAPLNINFTTGERHVKLWVGSSPPAL